MSHFGHFTQEMATMFVREQVYKCVFIKYSSRKRTEQQDKRTKLHFEK